MASIKQCPDTSEARATRSRVKNCPTLDNYHCLKTVDGQLSELCTSPIWIEAGKCPIYSITGKLDARICQTEESRYCPTKVYKSNLNFNYQGCLPSLRSESSTTNINGKYPTTQSGNFTVSGGAEVGSNLTGLVVLPLLLVFVIIVTLGIAWWKRKEIRKRLRNFGKPKKTSSKKETKRSEVEQELTTCSSAKSASLEEKKENTTASAKSDEECVCIVSEDDPSKDLPKEKQGKKKRKGTQKLKKIRNLFSEKVSSEKNKETKDKRLASDNIDENQSMLDADKDEQKSDEAESSSLQPKVPVSIGIEVSTGNIGKNEPTDTPQDIFIHKMADLLLDKDVLVLISSKDDEHELALVIAIKACENTPGANIRNVIQYNDLRNLDKEKIYIALFIHKTFKEKKWYRKDSYYATRTCEIVLDAMKTKQIDIHTLICLPGKVYDGFEMSLKKTLLKYAVYDIPTMQEHKTI